MSPITMLAISVTIIYAGLGLLGLVLRHQSRRTR